MLKLTNPKLRREILTAKNIQKINSKKPEIKFDNKKYKIK